MAQNENHYGNRVPLVYATYSLISAGTPAVPAQVVGAAAAAGGAAAGAGAGAGPGAAGAGVGAVSTRLNLLATAVLKAEIERRAGADVKDVEVSQKEDSKDGTVVVAFLSRTGFPVSTMDPSSAQLGTPPIEVDFTFLSNWEETLMAMQHADLLSPSADTKALLADPIKLFDTHKSMMMGLVSAILTDNVSPKVKQILGRRKLLRDAKGNKIWQTLLKAGGNVAVGQLMKHFGPKIMARLNINDKDLHKWFGKDGEALARSGAAMCTAAVSIGAFVSTVITVWNEVADAEEKFQQLVKNPMEKIGDALRRLLSFHKLLMKALAEPNLTLSRQQTFAILKVQLTSVKEIIQQLQQAKALVTSFAKSMMVGQEQHKAEAMAAAIDAAVSGLSLAMDFATGSMALAEIIGRSVTVGMSLAEAAVHYGAYASLTSLIGETKLYLEAYDWLEVQMKSYQLHLSDHNKTLLDIQNDDAMWMVTAQIVLVDLQYDQDMLEKCVARVNQTLKLKGK